MFPCSGRGRDIFLDIPLYRTGVGVEKLFPAKVAKIKSRQEALQTTFSVFLDIFYPPIFSYFEENGVFQHPRLVTTVTSELPVRDQNRRTKRWLHRTGTTFL